MKLTGLFALTLLAAACSAPDPGAVTFYSNPRDEGGGSRNTNPTDTTNDTGGGNSVTDGGTGGGGKADGGAGDSGAGNPNELFAGTYTSKKPAMTAKAIHAASANAKGTVPGKGIACLGCHNADVAPKFLFAGTVFSDAAGNTAAADAEVIVAGTNGRLVAHSDDDGNFWMKDDDGNGNTLTLPTAPKTGCRTTAVKSQMQSAPTGDCSASGCHNGAAGTIGVVHVP